MTEPTPDIAAAIRTGLPAAVARMWRAATGQDTETDLTAPAAPPHGPQDAPTAPPAGAETADTHPGPQPGAQAFVWPDYTAIAGRNTRWATRCLGQQDHCDGWLSLDHDTERWAQVALARHLREEHNHVVLLPDPAPDPDAVPGASHLADLLDQFIADRATHGANPDWLRGARCITGRIRLAEPGALGDDDAPAPDGGLRTDTERTQPL